MLVCFGSAWPFSIYKSWKSESNNGKSLLFLLIAFAGYIAGILHKSFYNFDFVIMLYVLNATMIMIDLSLYYRNYKLNLIKI